MFSDALKAMAEGETEAEKQIVYVLNEARAALPCPSFVARSATGERTLYVVLNGKAIYLVSVIAVLPAGCFEVSPFQTLATGTLALADAVIQALRESHAVIAQAAMEAGPKATLASRTGGISVADALAGFERLRGASVHVDPANGADAVQMFPAGFAGVSPGPSAPENDPKVLRAAMSRAFEEIRGMRKEFGNPDSDYGAGAKEACDRIAAALVITE
jgi:hypothetical protein